MAVKLNPKKVAADGGCSKKDLMQGHQKLGKATPTESPKGKRKK